MVNLYIQRDQIRWYWRAAATAAACLIFLGFIVFPSAWSEQSKVKFNTNFLTAFSICMLVLGFVTTCLLCWQCRNISFQLDVLFTPCLIASVLGLVNVAYNLVVNGAVWNSISIAAVTLAVTSTVAYSAAAIGAARSIDSIRKREARLRDPNTWHEDSSLLPEDEMTRQQLLRLLLKSDSDKPPSSGTNLSTFRIDIPDYRAEDEEERYLARPPSTYAGRSRSGSRTSADQHLSPSDYHLPSEHQSSSGYLSLGPTNPPSSPRRGRPPSRDMRRQEIETGQTRPEDVNLVPRINRVQTETWGPI
ncbi:MAG: hypothetical protein M1839_004279 [Geoglossum umbratile]|nr:MAG: hypothetical protein M1839_004279 [Geoglossum umbratile]